MTDVLERLRAANPIKDLVDAGTELRPPIAVPPAPGSRRARRLVAAAGVFAAVAIAVAIPKGTGSEPGDGARLDVPVAAAAAAALDPGDSILHVVTRVSQSGPDVPESTTTSELWLAPGGDGGRIRTTASDGTLLADFALTLATDGRLIQNDPIAGIRRMLHDGSLIPAGSAELDGREMQVFRHRPDEKGTYGDETWYFDARTLEPARMVFRPAEGRGRFTAITDYLAVDRLVDTPENRQVLVPPKTVMPRPTPDPGNQDEVPRTTAAETLVEALRRQRAERRKELRGMRLR